MPPHSKPANHAVCPPYYLQPNSMIYPFFRPNGNRPQSTLPKVVELQRNLPHFLGPTHSDWRFTALSSLFRILHKKKGSWQGNKFCISSDSQRLELDRQWWWWQRMRRGEGRLFVCTSFSLQSSTRTWPLDTRSDQRHRKTPISWQAEEEESSNKSIGKRQLLATNSD